MDKRRVVDVVFYTMEKDTAPRGDVVDTVKQLLDILNDLDSGYIRIVVGVSEVDKQTEAPVVGESPRTLFGRMGEDR